MIFLSDFLDVHEDHGLGTSDDDDSSSFADVALESECDFLGSFGFLSEDGFGLSSVAGLFAVVASSALGSFAFFALLVLGHLVHCVGLALGAVGLPGFGDHNHR